MNAEMSRKEFVIAGAALAAGVTVLSATGCTRTRSEKDPAIETPSATYGGANMDKRVLVAYATRTGSTVGVAEKIAETLAARGFGVDVKPLVEEPSLTGYDAVVIGSAVNGGAWLPEALGFVKAQQAALAGLPMAVFCVHSMNGGSDSKETAKRLAYLDEVRQLVTPAEEGFFLGMGPDPEDTSFIARWAFKAFGGSGEGDMRDWEAIASWANQVAL